MVIVSHDREFLDNLCTKIVETERGMATTYKGNYTEYMKQKMEKEALQWVAYEKQQKEIDKLQDMVRRLSGMTMGLSQPFFLSTMLSLWVWCVICYMCCPFRYDSVCLRLNNLFSMLSLCIIMLPVTLTLY